MGEEGGAGDSPVCTVGVGTVDVADVVWVEAGVTGTVGILGCVWGGGGWKERIDKFNKYLLDLFLKTSVKYKLMWVMNK